MWDDLLHASRGSSQVMPLRDICIKGLSEHRQHYKRTSESIALRLRYDEQICGRY